MSCRQNTSDLVESESPDGPGPFQATGAGAPQHKECSVSVRIPPRSPPRVCSPPQHTPLTALHLCLHTFHNQDNVINSYASFNSMTNLDTSCDGFVEISLLYSGCRWMLCRSSIFGYISKISNYFSCALQPT